VSESGVPFASLSSSFRFNHLVELFHTSDHSHEAELWRLCSALFDEPSSLDFDVDMDLSHLPSGIQRAIGLNRQKEALSDWLENCVKQRVESDLRMVPIHGTDSAPRRLFAMMSGNQIERACDEALDAKYLHFATLLAQSPDDVFREEIQAQLKIWTDEKVEEVICPRVLKLYETLGGRLVTEGVNDGQQLDWRRVFGLRLWYGETANSASGIEEVVREYEDLLSHNRVPVPTPWWLESSGQDPLSSPRSNSNLLDAHYLIMHLASHPSSPLNILSQPLSFSAATLDAKLPFFISLILNRCLKTRHFSDQTQLQPGPGRDNVPAEVYGSSNMAGSLIMMYASMLENVGCVKEAAFVLMFLTEAIG
jgi:nuclear pore complex protein Nup98-Nup96